MGFFRGGLFLIASISLFIVILLSSTFFVMFISLRYENFEKEFTFITQNLTGGKFNLLEESFDLNRDINFIIKPMREYCFGKEDAFEDEDFYYWNLNESLDYPNYFFFYSGGYFFNFSCETLVEPYKDSEILIEEAISQINYQIYYGDYDCGFWGCFKDAGISFFQRGTEGWGGTLFLVSNNARIYWRDKFYSSLVTILVITLIIFLLIKKKLNTFLVTGAFLVASSFVLLWVKKLLEESTFSYLMFANVFLNQTHRIFWIISILGLFLFSVGMILKFWRAGFFKKKFSKKDIKKIMKKESENKK